MPTPGDRVGDEVTWAVLLCEIGGSLRGWVELTRVGIPLADFPEVIVERKYKLNAMSSPRMIITTPPIRSQGRRDMPDIM
jgi:hypothetical protein